MGGAGAKPFAGIPLYDHHAHSLRRIQPAATEVYRAHFTESDSPEIASRDLGWSLFYRRALKDLGALFGCAPSEDAVLAARAVRSLADLTRALFTDAGIGALLVDPGFRTAEHYDLDGLRSLLPCPAAPLLRLEVLAERLIPASDCWPDLRERFAAGVRAAAGTVRGLKTIIAYRSGLDLRAWDEAALEAAFRETRDGGASCGPTSGRPPGNQSRLVPEGGGGGIPGPIRLASKPLLDALLWTALGIAAERGLPVQIHTGFGDRDLDLRLANPLWLRPVFEHAAFRPIRFVLLHSYPYVREAAWLSHVYPHVWMDLSLTVPFAAHAATDAIVETLGLAPASKVLLATDAFSIPELFWLGARYAREALAAALDVVESRGFAGPEDRDAIARRLLWDNAVSIYGPL